MPDYRRFKVTVSGRPDFAAFLLNLRDEELKRRIDKTLDTLKEQPDAGDLIQHALWPQEYKKLELDNLFRIEVGRSQRLTYSLQIDGDRVEVFVIDFFVTHKEYERRFHY